MLAWRATLSRAATGEQLLTLNAWTAVGGQTGQVLGAAASGLTLAAFGAVVTVACASGAYLGAAILGFVVSERLHTLLAGSRSAVRSSIRLHARALRDGWKH